MLLIKNKRASYDYQLEKKYLAGIVLSGAEVKSLRLGQGSLAGSYVKSLRGQKDQAELFLINAQINHYRFAATDQNYDPKRSRKLLLKRKEINELVAESEQKGRSIVPLAIVLEHNQLKLELALGKGKKTFEKREMIKKKDLSRELAKNLKRSQLKF